MCARVVVVRVLKTRWVRSWIDRIDPGMRCVSHKNTRSTIPAVWRRQKTLQERQRSDSPSLLGHSAM